MLPDRETREDRQHSTALCPYSHYECRIPELYMSVPMHWHSEFELIHIKEGRGEFICGSGRLEAGAGELILIPPNMLHAAYPVRKQEQTPESGHSEGGMETLVYDALVFSSVMLGTGISDRCTNECIRPLISGDVETNICIRKTAENYGEVKTVAQQIFACVQADSPQTDLLLKSELLRFVWILERSGDIVFKKAGKGEENETLRPALEYMAQNFREEITVEELAGLVHLSRSHFMKCFHRTVGISAMEHLSRLRINAACEALCESGERIADVAFSCGYSNLSNFNRQFLKKVGCSPKEYRKRNGAAD